MNVQCRPVQTSFVAGLSEMAQVCCVGLLGDLWVAAGHGRVCILGAAVICRRAVIYRWQHPACADSIKSDQDCLVFDEHDFDGFRAFLHTASGMRYTVIVPLQIKSDMPASVKDFQACMQQPKTARSARESLFRFGQEYLNSSATQKCTTVI